MGGKVHVCGGGGWGVGGSTRPLTYIQEWPGYEHEPQYTWQAEARL